MNEKMPRAWPDPTTLAILATLLLAIPAPELVAGMIFGHTGSTDPTTEGWTFEPGGGGGVSVGPIDDGGTLAWFVDDNSTASGSIASYLQSATAADVALGSALGWTLRLIIRVPDNSTAPDGSPLIAYRDGAKTWELNFGSQSDGDPIVFLATGFSPTTGFPVPLEGLGSTYNLYELTYDPLSSTADLLVNGVEEFSGYAGATLDGPTRVLWGVGTSVDTGQGNFNLIEMDIACPLLGDIDSSTVVDGNDIEGFIRVKLGAFDPGDASACADYGTGTLEGDVAAFVTDLLGP